MGKAFYCDKCGTSFSPISLEPNAEFTSISEICIRNPKQYINTIYGVRKCHINLCPECTKKFRIFMEDFKNEAVSLSSRYAYSTATASYMHSTNVTRGRYEYERPSGNSDCETSEWPDESK